MKVLLVLSLLAVVLFSISSCTKDYTEIDQALILDYIAEKNLNAIEGPSGIYYVIEEEGNGPNPNENSTVEVVYEGRFLDDRVFDSSGANTVVFPLANVITGWQLSLPLLKEGGKGTFIIPSKQAYGSRGSSSIPPNTVLVFDIELRDVN